MERVNLWRSPEHALNYLTRADTLPHRQEGEGVLLDLVPKDGKSILDLGTGNGRLVSLLRVDRPQTEFIGVDFSPTMLETATQRFAEYGNVQIIAHNLDEPLPELGRFAAVVSSFVIHHLNDGRKRELYAEVFEILEPGGIFCNLEHVSSPTPALHEYFRHCVGLEEEPDDPSNQLLDVQTQLDWLREIGFGDVDCYWKWLEFALLVGHKPN